MCWISWGGKGVDCQGLSTRKVQEGGVEGGVSRGKKRIANKDKNTELVLISPWIHKLTRAMINSGRSIKLPRVGVKAFNADRGHFPAKLVNSLSPQINLHTRWCLTLQH